MKARDSEIIIDVKDLSVVYEDLIVLENVNFNIKRGEIFLIVGGSGCGKSTLLRQLIGLERPTTGSIFVQGDDFISASPAKRMEIMKRFGVLFQSSGLFASMTLSENIALPLQAYTDLDTEEIAELAQMKLNAVGLSGFEGYLPSEISGGMKKRAAFARALALDPEILFFDEPSSGLDPMTAAALDDLIMDMNRSLGATMIIVSHDLDSILNIADRIILLDKEKRGIVAEGTPEELRNHKGDDIISSFFNRKAYMSNTGRDE